MIGDEKVIKIIKVNICNGEIFTCQSLITFDL